MKRFFPLFLFFVAIFAFSAGAEPSAFGGNAVLEFDAQDLFKGSDYDDISLVNKTGEKIELTVNAWSEKDNTWVKYGSVKTSDYNDTDTLSKTIRYKVTPMDKFRYFAITASKTRLEVKFELAADGETASIRASYAKPVRPLASLEAKPFRDKNGNGVGAELSFRNVSWREITTVEITLRASDKGMVVKHQKTGNDETIIRTKDPIKDGERYKTQTSPFWTDFAIDEVKITRVKIMFADGTEDSYNL